MRMTVRPGQEVKAGTSLLDIHYYGEQIEGYPVKQDSYIIGVRENPVVSEGDRVAFVGTEWSDWK